MPTWPSTTISTANLDAGSDRPSLARADLKQMADVVNELVNYGAPTGSVFFIVSSDLSTASGGTDKELTWNRTSGGTALYYNVVDYSSLRWTFSQSGTYILLSYGQYFKAFGGNVYLRNGTTSTNEINLTSGSIGLTYGLPFLSLPTKLVVANTSDQYCFYYDSTTGSSDAITGGGVTLWGLKVA